MPEEEVVASPEPTSTAVTADGHKRKFDDLEVNNGPTLLAESGTNEENGGGDDSENKRLRLDTQEEHGGGEETEDKRPCLETNGETTDGPVSLERHVVEKPESEPKEELPNEHEPKEEHEPRQELPNENEPKEELPNENEPKEELPNENEPKEELPNENEPKEELPSENEPADEDGQAVEGQEHAETVSQVPVSSENGKTENESTEQLEQPGAEVDKPSEELSQEGNVPMASAEGDESSDTQIVSHKMEVPNDKVGVLIGKAGDTIRSLQDNSGAKIQIMRDLDADPRAVTRPLELVGTLESVKRAEKLIKDVIAEADAGGSPSLVARGFNTVQAASGGEQVEIPVPVDKVGLIIGKGGETIRNLQTRSGARIQLIQQNLDGDQSKEKVVRVSGSKKQIETATEMIKDVMNQNVRRSPLSGMYNQSGYRPRGPSAPLWGPRAPHQAQFSGYDYPHRGPYPSQNSQYPPQSYGHYPPQQGPRSNFAPSWDHRPPALHGPYHQSNYNYGQQQGPEYGPPPPYSHTGAQQYSHGYNDAKYDPHASSQHFGHMGSQPTPYAQGGTHSGYGPQDQYGRQPMYNMQSQVSHPQPYGQVRPSQPGEVPYSGPVSSAQSYGQTMPPQQPYPYATSGATQQTYPAYGSSLPTDGYGNTASAASASGYPQGVQPVGGYGPAGSQQPTTYPQAGTTGGYGAYPAGQAGYAEQPVSTSAAYGYQATAPAYGATQAPVSYPATAGTAAVQPGYTQPSQTQANYDQSGGYGNV